MTCDDDGDAPDDVHFFPVSGTCHLRRVVADVHECSDHHLHTTTRHRTTYIRAALCVALCAICRLHKYTGDTVHWAVAYVYQCGDHRLHRFTRNRTTYVSFSLSLSKSPLLAALHLHTVVRVHAALLLQTVMRVHTVLHLHVVVRVHAALLIHTVMRLHTVLHLHVVVRAQAALLLQTVMQLRWCCVWSCFFKE